MHRVVMRMLIPLMITVLGATADASPNPKRVAIVVYEGAEILDFAGPTEVLAAAGNFAGESGKSALNVYLVARTKAPIKAQGVVTITPTYSIDDAPAPDVVVIPGGNSTVLSRDPKMQKWLTDASAASTNTLTVCTGAFPLAQAGVFDGMEITTFYGAIESLQSLAPKARVTNGRRFVDNGRYITTAGVSAGIDGALHLVARMFGRRVADQTARYMEYHWTPEPYLAKDYAYWNPSTDERGRLLQQADAAADEKRWSEAIAAYKKLATSDPDGSATYALGNALFRSGDRKASIAAYAKVQKASPSYRNAAYNLACAYALEKQADKALVALKEAFAAGISRDMALGDPDLASIKDRIAQLK